MKIVIKRMILIVFALIGVLFLYAGSAFLYRTKVIMEESGGTVINKAERPNTALLVIDVQTGYTNTPDSAEKTASYIGNINKLIDKSSSSNIETIYVAAVRGDSILDTLLAPDLLNKKSPEADLDSRLIKGYGRLFVKTKADAFHVKDFETYLEKGKIGRLIVAGIATEVCVGETVKGALRRGFDVEVVRDASIPIFGESSQEKRIKDLSSRGAKIVTTSSLAAAAHL